MSEQGKAKKAAVRPRPFLKVERLSGMSRQRKAQIVTRGVSRMEEVRPLIAGVMEDVRRHGDRALVRYTRKFDRVNISPRALRVSKAEIAEAYRAVRERGRKLVPQIAETMPAATRRAMQRIGTDPVAWIKQSLACITAFHEAERDQIKRESRRSWRRAVRSPAWPKGVALRVGQERLPIERVGVYVPGGNATLFTTAMMAIAPARVAGVPEIVVCSPPSRNGDIDPMIVVAADLAGATTIIRAGGAQAIAAMAYGTESVPRVHKIFGPGNTYVSAAKTYVASSGVCAIDFLAGPSEVVVVADDSADPVLAARDMASQAEHDADACAVLVTDSARVAEGVRAGLPRIIAGSGRADESTVALRSLTRYGAIILADSMDEALRFANEFAPEHLELMVAKPERWLKKVRNAGTVCLGHYSPVAVGDYICPNHILPTGGAARYTSGVNLSMFYRTPSKLRVPKNALPGAVFPLIAVLATAEGLYAQHGLSVAARLGARSV
jgi:histidinol dehydrogenase